MPGRPAPTTGPGTAVAVTTMLSMLIDAKLEPAPMFAVITKLSMTSAETPLNTVLKTAGGARLQQATNDLVGDLQNLIQRMNDDAALR